MFSPIFPLHFFDIILKICAIMLLTTYSITISFSTIPTICYSIELELELGTVIISISVLASIIIVLLLELPIVSIF